MEIVCLRCKEPFDAASLRGYCDDCVQFYATVRRGVNNCQRPMPGVCLDGKFTKEPSPQTVADLVNQKSVCGLCGSDKIESGYGLGSGYGMGSYNFCCDCSTFLDFCEDYE